MKGRTVPLPFRPWAKTVSVRHAIVCPSLFAGSHTAVICTGVMGAKMPAVPGYFGLSGELQGQSQRVDGA